MTTVVDDEFDDEFDENSDMLYFKYLFEGLSSISDLAGALRAWAEDLERRAADGWRLEQPVDGGWALLARDNS